MSLSHPCTRTIASYLVHGLKRLLRCEASRSPWSERKDDGRLARKSNSTNCYRENYERKVSQKDCLNIATVNTVNPVFPVFKHDGIYGKYGIYGQTYQALILLIFFLSRHICRVSLLSLLLLPFLLKIQRTSVASASGGNKIRDVVIRFI